MLEAWGVGSVAAIVMQGAPKLFQILILNVVFNFERLMGLD